MLLFSEKLKIKLKGKKNVLLEILTAGRNIYFGAMTRKGEKSWVLGYVRNKTLVLCMVVKNMIFTLGFPPSPSNM